MIPSLLVELDFMIFLGLLPVKKNGAAGDEGIARAIPEEPDAADEALQLSTSLDEIKPIAEKGSIFAFLFSPSGIPRLVSNKNTNSAPFSLGRRPQKNHML